ncbi:unnamed protein product [Rotaria sp. Silwood1]|nr:unnamed protein product [Rotaria sp. Silwood1]CAF1539985.1 unnamed protein product [Rotaria sp. Silwood1]CAF3637488.1 unnamed protein product [Rotaria sp. Silwood1]CAF4833100.1 unnamed protein product [Rotaria sp. Silwood1]
MIGGWTDNPANYIGVVCKLRAFLVFSTRTMAMWLIVLATVDRWLLSSFDVHRRQKSSLKNVQRGTVVIVILSLLLYAQQLYCYDANRMDTPLKCYGTTNVCRNFTDLSLVIATVTIPLILMVLFGVLIISNVHQSRRRIQILTLQNAKSTMDKSLPASTGDADRKSKQKIEHSLLRMLFFQVILMTIFTIPLCLDKFYSSFSGDNGSKVEMAINAFVYDLAILIYDISNGIPFYIYTLCGGTVFRKALHNFITSMKLKFRCH